MSIIICIPKFPSDTQQQNPLQEVYPCSGMPKYMNNQPTNQQIRKTCKLLKKKKRKIQYLKFTTHKRETKERGWAANLG